MSSETACFNGYAEEILGVQMADALFFDAIFTAGAGTRYGRGGAPATLAIGPHCPFSEGCDRCLRVCVFFSKGKCLKIRSYRVMSQAYLCLRTLLKSAC